MNEYLFLFTITPVQSFIQQARKTQDLYAGSFLLSHLIRKAAQKAESQAKEEDAQARIIFPNLENLSLPNRFILKLNLQPDKLSVFGGQAQETIYDELRNIGEAILKEIRLPKPDFFDRQLENYFSVHWIFVPVLENDYHEAYRKIEQMLGAIKNLRDFEQFEERGRKCSLDGQNNAIFFRRTSRGKIPAYIELINKPTEINSEFGILPGEGLSAVSFLKRFLHKAKIANVESSFPSTARIALLHILEKLEDNKNQNEKALYDDFKSSIGKSHYDEQLLFRENITVEYFKKQGLDRLIPEIDELKEKQRRVHQCIDEKLKQKLSSYYALLIFDADDMGKWLSGKFLNRKIQNGFNIFHQTLSKQLGEFAKFSHEYLQSYRGKTVYAGGDDFMGLVNLKSLFESMKELRIGFNRKIEMSVYSNKPMTFSAGVIIAHYKTPLSEVLKRARALENKAKNIKDKDSFALAVLRHSGEVHETVWKWQIEDKWTIDIFATIAKKLSQGIFSNTFINVLAHEFLNLIDNRGRISFLEIEEKEAFNTEIRRLLLRSWMGRKYQNISHENLERVKHDELEEMVQSVSLLLHWSMQNLIEKPIQNFLSTLHIIDFFSNEVNYDD